MLVPFIATAALQDEEDRAFMSRLWRQYHRLMFFIARRYASEPSVLEDIVSDACLRLMEHVDTLRDLSEPQLRAYIRQTVRSRAIQQLRRAGREAALSPDDLPWEGEGPWRGIELREELELLRWAVARLPEAERQAVRLRYGDGLRGAALAGRLGVAESTARRYLAEAKRRLKDMIYADGKGEDRE